MMSKGRHYSCPRCGYRGTNPEHACNPTDLITDIASGRVYGGDAPPGAATVPITRSAINSKRVVDDVALDATRTVDVSKLVGEFARLLGRTVTVAREPLSPYGYEAVTTVQRCRVCRAEIKATVAAFRSAEELAAKLASSISHSYLTHECPSAEQSLFSFTYDQLAELHEQLERDFSRIGDRILEIERLMGRRRG